MSESDERYRAVLTHNVGFDEPERWLGYARSHGFREVDAVPVPRCPDCGGEPGRRAWGQYVYYSTLIRLRECAACGLVWADAHISPDVVRQHFEHTYKDDEYFRMQRRPIFRHLAAVIDRLAPRGANVLDIGGARGDLMAVLAGRRPDVVATVNDLSVAATEYAARHHGFETVTGGAEALAGHDGRYHVVVMSDVLYYEPALPALWSAVARLLRPDGAVVIRVPNKYWLTRVGLWRDGLADAAGRRAPRDRVPFFNPEHIYILRQRYLRQRLRGLGFRRVRALPSPLLARGEGALLDAVAFRIAAVAGRVSGQRAVLTPGMLLVASGFDAARAAPPRPAN